LTAKINSPSTDYLGEQIYQSNEVKNIFLAVDSDVDTAAIRGFIQLLCDHLDIRFPEEELMEWHTFDEAVIVKRASVEQLY
jgi:acyl carrier protein